MNKIFPLLLISALLFYSCDKGKPEGLYKVQLYQKDIKSAHFTTGSFNSLTNIIISIHDGNNWILSENLGNDRGLRKLSYPITLEVNHKKNNQYRVVLSESPSSDNVIGGLGAKGLKSLATYLFPIAGGLVSAVLPGKDFSNMKVHSHKADVGEWIFDGDIDIAKNSTGTTKLFFKSNLIQEKNDSKGINWKKWIRIILILMA